MKLVILILLFGQSIICIGQGNDIITITPIGASDKPRPAIVIYHKEVAESVCLRSVLDSIGSDFRRQVIADTSDINIFVEVLKYYSDLKPDLTDDWNLFEIAYYQDKDCTKKWQIADGRISRSFFGNAITRINEKRNKGNNDIIKLLEGLSDWLRL